MGHIFDILAMAYRINCPSLVKMAQGGVSSNIKFMYLYSKNLSLRVQLLGFLGRVHIKGSGFPLSHTLQLQLEI